MLPTKQPIAQLNSTDMISTNLTLSSVASFNVEESNSMPMETFAFEQKNEEKAENTSSSCDIFSQIGNLVRSNQIPEDKQLPYTMGKSDEDTNQNETSPTSTTKLKRSKEASSIISAFPLLDFMRSPVLMTPVKSENHFHHNNISSPSNTKDDYFLHEMKLEHNSSTSVFGTNDIAPNNCNLYTLNVTGNSP